MRSISRCAVNPVHGPGDNQRNLPAIFHQAGAGMEQNPVSVEPRAAPRVLPIDRNENIASQDPRLALDGHVQFTSSEADRIGGTSP